MHAFWEFLEAGTPAVSAIIALLALIFSIASFAYVSYDRRIKLVVRAAKAIGMFSIRQSSKTRRSYEE